MDVLQCGFTHKKTASSKRALRSMVAPKPRMASHSTNNSEDDDFSFTVQSKGFPRAKLGIRRSVSAPSKMMSAPSDAEAARELRRIFTTPGPLVLSASTTKYDSEGSDDEEYDGEEPPRFSADPVQRVHRASASPPPKSKAAASSRDRPQKLHRVHRNLFNA